MHTLRGILLNPGLAGLRTLGGAVVGPATWDPILTEEESAKVRAVLTDPARRVSRPPRRYLLTGLLFCGRCGAKLITRPNRHRPTYVCGSGPALSGCGRISILAEHLEAFVAEAVLHRLDGPALAEALTNQGADPDEHVIQAITADESQLEELSHAWANRMISMPEWLSARKLVEDRLTQARARLIRRDRNQRLRDAAGKGGVLSKQWPFMNLDQRRAIIGAILDRVVVNAARVHGRSTLEVERLEPIWKL
jgi:site-specific DNA recombinase